MKSLIGLFAALCVGVVAGGAAAQGIPGDAKANKFYAGLHGGATIVSDSDLSGGGITDTKAELSTGFNVGGVFGYKFMNGVRIEGEYTYRQADFDDIKASGVSFTGSGIGVGGDIGMHAIMANGFWEPRLGGNWLPYLGAGLGVGILNADLQLSVPALGTFGGEESDTVFAYQFGAGLGYAVTNNVIISADYRYWATTNPDFDGLEAEIGTHNISGGIRYQF